MMHIEPTTVAVIAAFTIGLTVGVVAAVLALVERRHWVVCVRLPEDLHRKLRDEATDHMCSLKAEIIKRLQASLGQPEVVDAPGLGRD